MSEPFRDPEAGAIAKRTHLLGKRRDELVMMPHAVRRVVVARWGRIAGALAAWLGAEAMVIAAVSPTVSRWVTNALPGKEPAPLSTLLVAAWVLGLLAYWIARSTAEHRFAVTMSRTVLPGEDVFHDIERLDHVHPDEVARGMAHRLEVLSAALPVAAAATIVPATATYLATLVVGHHWPSERAYEAWLVSHAHALAWTALVGLGAAMMMTKTRLRQPTTAPIAATLAVLMTGFTPFVWWLVGPIAIAVVAAFVVHRLVKERALIQAEDPAAGSEVFTLRGFIAEVRANAIQVRAFVRAHRRGFVIAAASLATVGLGWKLLHPKTWKDPAPPTVAIASLAEPPAAQHGTRYESQAGGRSGGYRLIETPYFADHGAIRLEADLRKDVPLTIPSVFPGLQALPPGWHAHLRIHYDHTDGRGVSVTAFPHGERDFENNPQWLDDANRLYVADVKACGQEVPLGALRLRADANGPEMQHVTLILEPTIELASCP